MEGGLPGSAHVAQHQLLQTHRTGFPSGIEHATGLVVSDQHGDLPVGADLIDHLDPGVQVVGQFERSGEHLVVFQ